MLFLLTDPNVALSYSRILCYDMHVLFIETFPSDSGVDRGLCERVEFVQQKHKFLGVRGWGWGWEHGKGGLIKPPEPSTVI